MVVVPAKEEVEEKGHICCNHQVFKFVQLCKMKSAVNSIIFHSSDNDTDLFVIIRGLLYSILSIHGGNQNCFLEIALNPWGFSSEILDT
jgi:hypothetical protein